MKRLRTCWRRCIPDGQSDKVSFLIKFEFQSLPSGVRYKGYIERDGVVKEASDRIGIPLRSSIPEQFS